MAFEPYNEQRQFVYLMNVNEGSVLLIVEQMCVHLCFHREADLTYKKPLLSI